MYCKKCEKTFGDEVIYCDICGSKLEKEHNDIDSDENLNCDLETGNKNTNKVDEIFVASTKKNGFSKLQLGLLVTSIAIFLSLLIIISNQSLLLEPIQWEYKVVSVLASENSERINQDAFKFKEINVSESDLNSFGMSGWELVSSYLEMETSFPNFGDSDYVTGIQSNVRPQRLVLILKRPVDKDKSY